MSESNTTKNSEVAERGRATMKMPKEKIDISMFAPCGMNCKVCYKHCYHKKPCAGCLNSDKGKSEHCRKCKIKDCIKEKSLSYCFECAKYPCSLIKNLEKSGLRYFLCTASCNGSMPSKPRIRKAPEENGRGCKKFCVYE